MLDQKSALRLDRLYNSGRKHAFAEALNVLRLRPAEAAINAIQSDLWACEDRENELDAQLDTETVIPLHSAIL